MAERLENPKIKFCSTIVLFLCIQKHGIWTMTEEKEIRRNGDDLLPVHSWRLVQEHCFQCFKRDSQKQEVFQKSSPQNYWKE